MEQRLKLLHILHIPLATLIVIQAVKPSHAFIIDFTLISAPLRVLMLQKNRIISRRQLLLGIASLSVIVPVAISILIDSFFNIEDFMIPYYLWNLLVSFFLLYIIIRYVMRNCANPSLMPDMKDLKRIIRNAFMFMVWCAAAPLLASHSKYEHLWLWLLSFMVIFSFAEYSGRRRKKPEPMPYKMVSESYAPVVEDNTGSQLVERLKKYLIQEQGCLNKKLTEKGLAQELGTNRCYLSRTVNSRLGCSIPIYINKCRIYFACKMMIENPDFTNNYISECCGFAASSTFNNSFKKATGKTPHIWRREAMIVTANTGKYEFDELFKELDGKED